MLARFLVCQHNYSNFKCIQQIYDDKKLHPKSATSIRLKYMPHVFQFHSYIVILAWLAASTVSLEVESALVPDVKRTTNWRM